MSGVPASQDHGTDHPDPRPRGDQPSPAAAGRRSRRKKIVTPLVLAVLGLAMLAIAFAVYPKTPEAPTPGYSELIITSAVPINYVQYDAYQVAADKAKISVSVVLPASVRARLPTGATTVQVWLPIGDAFTRCPPPACKVIPQGSQISSYWKEPLTFTSAGGSAQAATTDFMVKAPDFGSTFNGIDASAAIPEVRNLGPANPEPVLIAGYAIKSAGSYDWSSFQPEDTTSHSAVWQEDIPRGDTASRVAVGVNHGGQSRGETLSLVAGTLLGLAGAAILAAIQEALHAND